MPLFVVPLLIRMEKVMTGEDCSKNRFQDELHRGGEAIKECCEEDEGLKMRKSESEAWLLYQNSEERYKKSQEAGHIGSWEYDIRNETFWGSDEGKRIYGFDVASDVFTSDEVMKLVVEPGRVNQAMIDLIENNKPYNIVFDIIPRESLGRRTINSIAELVRDETGNPVKVTGVLLDITEHKRTLEALTMSEIRYRSLFEAAKDGILILDAETGMIMDVNPFLIGMLGYSKEQFLKKAIWEIGFLKDIIANQEKFVELQQKEYIRYADMPLETADGRRINVEFISNVFLADHLKFIQCNIRDTTNRKLAEDRIKLSAKILTLLNTATPFNETINLILDYLQKSFGFDAIGIRFKQGEDYPYLIQNGFNAEFLRTEDSLIERNGDGVICRDENDKACLACTCGLVISGHSDAASPLFTEGGSFWTNDSSILLGLTSEEEPRYHPRNHCIHDGFMSIALIPIRQSGEIVGLLQLNKRKNDYFTPVLISFFESIGETIGVALMRKQGEEALHESEALYRNLVEKSLDGVYKSSHEGKFIEVNSAMVKMLGYSSKEELKEIDIKTQLYFEPSDRESLMAQEIREESGVYSLKRKDGSAIWVEDHAWYDFDENGEILFHEGIIRDVSERKQREDEIRKLNESLEQQVIERTSQLESSNKKLAFQLMELEQFAYITNHDLQEPLRTLTHFTQLITDDYSDKLDEDGKKYIEFIHNAGFRMKELVMDLLEYSLLGKEVALTLVDCNEIVGHVLADLEDSIGASRALITVQQLPVLPGFPTELRLLFQNLIMNAIKFQKKDVAPVINISVESQETEWLFSVSDNGIGIDEKYNDKIFIIFQRLHNRSDYEGTGIGLAHCKKIVELHGGRIWVESKPGEGSSFRFTIHKI